MRCLIFLLGVFVRFCTGMGEHACVRVYGFGRDSDGNGIHRGDGKWRLSLKLCIRSAWKWLR